MPKHKLYLDAESSPRFSSSADSALLPGGKKLCRANPDGMKTKITASKGLDRPAAPQPSTSKVTENNNVSLSHESMNGQRKRKERPRNDIDIDTDTDLDSDVDLSTDTMDVPGFFSNSNQKLPYSFEEDEEIIKFVLSSHNVLRASSVTMWKQLEAKKSNPKRTYQSLKNRFLRNIKPNLFTTYSHLIRDKEITREILIKFPELKHQRNRGRETLPRIILPKRIPLKVPEGSPSRQQNCPSTQIPASRAQPENARTEPEPIYLNPHRTEKLSFRRKLKCEGDSITVVVNIGCKKSSPPSRFVGIFQKFQALKANNKLTRCTACGNYRSSGDDVDHSPDSSAESDVFISNSVESKKSPAKRDSRLRKETKGAEELNPIPESCSQSLLNDVNEVSQLDENEGGNAQKNNEGTDDGKEKETPVVEGNSDPIVPEEADQPASTDKETESIFKSAVEEFRKLIDSDEEEVLVKKCLRKNRRTIGFDANLSVEEIRVDSFFINATSPVLESEPPSSSLDGKTGSSSSSTLYKNMISMMEKRVGE